MIDHNPQRPQWTCADDGDNWPCEMAKKLLCEAYPDADELARYLLRMVISAVADLGVAEAKLYRRFVAWALPGNGACRVCGRVGHDVLPDLPPRLFPCDGYAIEPLMRPKED